MTQPLLNAKPFEISKSEKEFYQDLLQHDEQVINQSDIQHHSNKKITTLQYNDFIFKENLNPHLNIPWLTLNIPHKEYVCKSRDSGCNCKLCFYPQFHKWTQSTEHSHPPPRLYFLGEVKLAPEKRRELFDYLYTNVDDSVDVNRIVNELNSKLSSHQKGNPIYEVKAKHVESARNKIIQLDKLTNWNELTKGPMTRTCSDEEFLRVFESPPKLNMFYCCPTQETVLKGITDCDYLCMDVSYEDCPTGTTQLVSILVKKPNLDAYPVLFVLSREKREEQFYARVWEFIKKLHSSINNESKLNIRIEQLEENIFKATRKAFPKSQISGSTCHWKQIINCWIQENSPTLVLPEVQQKLMQDLQYLSEIPNVEQFQISCQHFIDYYSKVDSEFASFMLKSFIRNDSTFPPTLWASSQQDNQFKDNSLDTSLKQYNKKVNAEFKIRPPLKESILILQQFEYLASIGNLYNSASSMSI